MLLLLLCVGACGPLLVWLSVIPFVSVMHLCMMLMNLRTFRLRLRAAHVILIVQECICITRASPPRTHLHDNKKKELFGKNVLLFTKSLSLRSHSLHQ
ncbi:membrane-associated protein, putative [Bodo saltans]|uniref:Membrane-associated protein, putative n=1 Tax=Bodo saltans TaxID=75058 RepID=A0A0S4IQG3_BODSA|nr:membrane-associated protein, putative [Bodo saltans]|eukprot:CUF95607.1 membrane-associated protein, putative [Bodo saltans]